MNEYIIVRDPLSACIVNDPRYRIYELQGDGSYHPAPLWADYGIRNDPCSMEEACSRLTQVIDRVIDDHLPIGQMPL